MSTQGSSKKILIASHCYWNHPSARIGEHHYAKYFADDGWKVFWTSNPVSPFHTVKRSNSDRFKNSLKGVREKDGIRYCIPFTALPFHNKWPFHLEWIGKNSMKFCFPPMKSTLRKNKFLDVDILWIRDLSQYYLLNIVKYRKLVLRLVDDLPAYETSPESVMKLQNMLIKAADCVLITSSNLTKYEIPRKPEFHYVPNGVELDHFKIKQAQPVEYKDIPNPRVLYAGSIASWFDLELMNRVITGLPDYNFILVGSVKVDLSILTRNQNVFILGPKDYSVIPSYMQHADVGVIPFKQDDLTKSVSPIKMFDYLASGIPVVSTHMQEAESLNPPVYFVNNADEFLTAVREACRGGKDQPKFYRFAENNSWKSRYEKIKSILKV